METRLPGGAKGLKVVGIGIEQIGSRGAAWDGGALGRHVPSFGDQLKVLGQWIDKDLKFRQQHQEILEKLRLAG